MTEINLSSNKISNVGATAQAIAVKLTLTYIDVRFNPIDLKGAEAFVDALKVNTSIINLHIH